MLMPRPFGSTTPGNASVNPDLIVETDAIWGDQALLGALKRPVDFIVASHVVEHVPDLVTWLSELHSALTEGGQVRLCSPRLGDSPSTSCGVKLN